MFRLHLSVAVCVSTVILTCKHKDYPYSTTIAPQYEKFKVRRMDVWIQLSFSYIVPVHKNSQFKVFYAAR